jgi:hypothetical protein
VSDSEDVFARLHLTGGRFRGGGMPVEALAELVAYQQLVVGVAQEIFRNTYPDRQRLPRGFAERLQLRLRSVEDGSAMPVLERVRESQALMPVTDDEFTRSRDLIEDAVGAIAAGDDLPEAFPRNAVVLFNRFGQTLHRDEAIELRRGTATSGPRYTQDVRRRLVLGERRTVQAEISDIGWVLEIDSARMTCQIRLRSAPQPQPVPGPVDEVNFDPLKAAMEPDGNGPPVRITGVGVYNTAGRLLRFDSLQDVGLVEDPENLEALDSRLADLAALSSGWLDGEGVPPTHAALRKADSMLAELLTLGAPRPRLYPTLEGGVEAEWTAGKHEISITFEPDGSWDAVAVNRDSGESPELATGEAGEIAEFIRQAS